MKQDEAMNQAGNPIEAPKAQESQPDSRNGRFNNNNMPGQDRSRSTPLSADTIDNMKVRQQPKASASPLINKSPLNMSNNKLQASYNGSSDSLDDYNRKGPTNNLNKIATSLSRDASPEKDPEMGSLHLFPEKTAFQNLHTGTAAVTFLGYCDNSVELSKALKRSEDRAIPSDKPTNQSLYLKKLRMSRAKAHTTLSESKEGKSPTQFSNIGAMTLN